MKPLKVSSSMWHQAISSISCKSCKCEVGPLWFRLLLCIMVPFLLYDANTLGCPHGVKENIIHQTRPPSPIGLWSSSNAHMPIEHSHKTCCIKNALTKFFKHHNHSYTYTSYTCSFLLLTAHQLKIDSKGSKQCFNTIPQCTPINLIPTSTSNS